jgi:hypothetical protein
VVPPLPWLLLHYRKSNIIQMQKIKWNMIIHKHSQTQFSSSKQWGTGFANWDTDSHTDKHKWPLLETDITNTCKVQNKLMHSIQQRYDESDEKLQSCITENGPNHGPAPPHHKG